VGSTVNFLGEELLDTREEYNSQSKPIWTYADCHAQILGPTDTYPLNHNGDLAIDACSIEEYAKFRENKNIKRSVLVQPEHYGTDNNCLLDAISSLSKHSGEDETPQIKGIANIESNLEDEKLESLANLGVVGVKFEMRRGLSGLSWEEADRLAWRINDLGWTIELYIDGSDIHEVEKNIKSWPGWVVFPHLGQFQRTVTTQQRGFTSLTRLIDRDKAWVKISAPYILSPNANLDDQEVTGIITALAKWAPERLVWGTNWPHLEKEGDTAIDDELLVLMNKWVPNEAKRKLIMCENANILYNFTVSL
tara:strand:- start:327 stop:1247 length:921 start_codon:yes stop_codon:yes gene_type:complete